MKTPREKMFKPIILLMLLHFPPWKRLWWFRKVRRPEISMITASL